MTELYATGIFLFVLFLLLGSSVWIGLALMGVAYVGMELFTSRPPRRRDDHHDLDRSEQLDPNRVAPVYLDGRNTLSHAII